MILLDLSLINSIYRKKLFEQEKKKYTLNVLTTPLEKAKEYVESALKAANKGTLEENFPNFDKNYKALQNVLKTKCANIKRIDMPVIEPQDIDTFVKRIEEGYLDIFPPYAHEDILKKYGLKSRFPKEFPSEEARKVWLQLGTKKFDKAQPEDDSIEVERSCIPVKKLYPIQNEIWIENFIGMYIAWGVPQSCDPKKTVIVSADNYILDGHHRWALFYVVDPDKLGLDAVKVPMKIDDLLLLGKSYQKAVGNPDKA